MSQSATKLLTALRWFPPFSPEIIRQLRTPFQGEPLRPLLNEELCDESISVLLRACWSENPDHRPPFGSIRRQLRNSCPDRSGIYINVRNELWQRGRG